MTPQAMAAQCKSLGILCRGFSFFGNCAVGSPPDACQLGQPLNGPRQYPYMPQVGFCVLTCNSCLAAHGLHGMLVSMACAAHVTTTRGDMRIVSSLALPCNPAPSRFPSHSAMTLLCFADLPE